MTHWIQLSLLVGEPIHGFSEDDPLRSRVHQIRRFEYRGEYADIDTPLYREIVKPHSCERCRLLDLAMKQEWKDTYQLPEGL